MESLLKKLFLGDEVVETTGLKLVFAGPLGLGPALVLITVVTIIAAWYYWGRLAKLRTPSRIGLCALRCLVIALVLALLLDPCIVGVEGHPGDQVVALVFDDSRSMQIAGVDGQTRGERLQESYAKHGADFEEALSERFELVRYAAGLGVERISKPGNLQFGQNTSDLTGAVESTLRDLTGAKVSAVVLFTDGAQQADTEKSPEELAGLDTPVFTIGTDTAAAWRDLELTEFAVTRTNFDQSPVEVTARIHASGLDGEEAVIEVLDEGRVSAVETVRINDDDADHAVTLDFIPTRQDLLTYTLRVRHRDTGSTERTIAVDDITLPDKDRVIQNNTREFLVDNREKEYRILQFSGSPNWETKFFRRSMDEDKQLKLTSLIRISRADKTITFRGAESMNNNLFEGFDDEAIQPRYDESVFLRMGVEKSELVTGYPELADELFPYDLVIWSDIEHNFFSPLQLEITREFVQKRGGTLLLLGGPRSFAEGGFGGTIIDGMLPVVLRAIEPGTIKETSVVPFVVQPTVDGVFNGAWALDQNPDINNELWMGMAQLHGLNVFSLTRAGATVMARVNSPDSEYDGQPFFAIQPYGMGRCAVVSSGETWSWRMQTDENDTRHARLWRQIVRSLVDGAPRPTELREKEDVYTIGTEVGLDVLVRDKRFQARDGLLTSAQMIGPDGSEQDLPIEESISETGVYTMSLSPTSPGTHKIRFTALDENDEVVGRIEDQILVRDDQREFQNAQFDTAYLTRIAKATGGEYFPISDLASVAEAIPWKSTEVSEEELFRRHLWYWPPFLFLAIALLTIEWYIRRKRGAP